MNSFCHECGPLQDKLITALSEYGTVVAGQNRWYREGNLPNAKGAQEAINRADEAIGKARTALDEHIKQKYQTPKRKLAIVVAEHRRALAIVAKGGQLDKPKARVVLENTAEEILQHFWAKDVEMKHMEMDEADRRAEQWLYDNAEPE